MKKVLLWSHTSNLSGAPISLAQLAERLPEHGYDPIYATPSHGPMGELLAEKGIRHVVIEKPWRALRFIRLVQREKPALVHVNSLVNTWPVLLCRFLRKPVIWHVRENLGKKKGYARLIHLAATRVVLISKRQATLFKGLRRVSYIPNAVDPTMYKGAKPADIRARDNRETLVVSIGSVEPRKGTIILAKAAAMLKEKPWIHFAIVGETKNEYASYRREIETYVEEHELATRFRFVGPRTDIPNILAAADIMCHPAYVEAFGRVILEAMASGVPVIGSAIGEIPEILSYGEAGVLVRPGDEEGLADAIMRLDEKRELRAELAAKAFRRVNDLYNLKVQVKMMVDVYNDLLGGKVLGEEGR